MLFQLVLNLGHSPLYRHFYKCLYIEFETFPRHDIAKASFALLIWLDGNAVKNFTCLLTITYILHTSDFRLHSAQLKQVWLCTRWHENSSLDNLKASFHCSHLSKMLAYCQSDLFHDFRLHSAQLKQVWLCTRLHENLSGRRLKKSLQPLNTLDKVFTLKNSSELNSIRLIRLLVKNLPRYSQAERPCIFTVLMML